MSELITTAKVVLKNGRSEVRMEMSDSHGLAVGNEYNINLDGKIREWRIVKIEPMEERS